MSLISFTLLTNLLDSGNFQEQLLGYIKFGDSDDRFIAGKGLQLELARQQMMSRIPEASYPDNDALYLIATAIKLGVRLATGGGALTIADREEMNQATDAALLAVVKELEEEERNGRRESNR